MSISRTVWGIGTPRTWRPLWALAEIGLAYNHEKIVPRGSGMDNPTFVALSQRHKIPFYEDDREQIGESAAIVTYLADVYGDSRLPISAPGTAVRAVLQDRAFFVMTVIDVRLYNVRLHGEPPSGLSEKYGASTVSVEAAKEYVTRGLNESARWLEDGRTYVMGEQFTIIDILLVSCLDWTSVYGMELPPALRDYRERVASRPGYKTSKANNNPSKA